MLDIIKPDKTIYKPNAKVKLTVVNDPVANTETGEITYKTKLTLATTYRRSEPLVFKDGDDIADFMGTVDYDDPQQELAI